LAATDIQKSSQIPIYERNIYNIDQPTVPSRGGPLDIRMVSTKDGLNLYRESVKEERTVRLARKA
jgi:hypothetical protein